MVGMAVVLQVQEGSRRSSELRYESPALVTFGRGTDCTVVLDDPNNPPQLSRRHCALQVTPPRVWIRDLGSKNGTWLNGDRVPVTEGDGIPVASGDRVQLGDVAIDVFVKILFTCPSCKATWEEKLSGSAIPAVASRICLDCSQVQFRSEQPPVPAAPARKEGPPEIPGYTIERELGRGAMGVVFLARRGSDPVALKVILPDRAGDAKQRELFVREATLARQLKHPHIVEMYEAGEHEGSLWMATEFCSGGNLEAYQEELDRREVPIPDAVNFIIQALEGLEFAHEATFHNLAVDGQLKEAKGLVHRDFKPQNLLLGGADGRQVKIADYGLAKAYELAAFSGLTRTGDIGGTPYFMSRWQAANYKYAGPECDVWAAAASLYWMMTGYPPRDFDNPATWMNTVMRALPVKVRVRNSDIPSDLAKVVDSALFDLDKPNYPTARSFREALLAVKP